MSQRLSLSGQQLSLDSWVTPGNKTQKSKENLGPPGTRFTKRKRASSEAGEEQGTSSKIRKKVSRKSSSPNESQSKVATGLQTPSTVQRPKSSKSTKRFDLQRDEFHMNPTSRTVLPQQRRDAQSFRIASLPTPETSRRPTTERHAPSCLAQTALPRTPTSARVQRQLVGGGSSSSPFSLMSSSPTAVRRHAYDAMRSPRTGPHSTPQSQRIVACSQQTVDERESQGPVFNQSEDDDANPFVATSAYPVESHSRDYDLPALSSPSSASGRSASISGAVPIFKVPALPVSGNRMEPTSPKATADVGSPMTPKKEIVPSSQSQYLFAGSSPSRMHGLSQFSSPSNDRRKSDFVPTSQSQEVEMSVPEKLNLQFFGDTLPTYSFGQASKSPSRDTVAAHRSPHTSPSKPDKRLVTPRQSQASKSSGASSTSPVQYTMNSSQTEPDDCPTVVGESQLVQEVDDDDMPMSLNTDPRYRDTRASIQQLAIDDSETESDTDGEDLAPASDGTRPPPSSVSPVPPSSASSVSLPRDSRSPSASRAPSTSTHSSSLRISRRKLRNAPRLLTHIQEGNDNTGHGLPSTSASHTHGITQSSLPSSYFEMSGSLPSAVGDFLEMMNDVDSEEDGA